MDYPWAVPGTRVVYRGPITLGIQSSAVCHLTQGSTYVIREVFENTDGTIGVRLRDIINGINPWLSAEYGYPIADFRPLISQSDDLAMFQRIADKAGHRVPEGV